MCPDKPALFHANNAAECFGPRVFRLGHRPQGRSKVPSMLVDCQGLIAVLNPRSQTGVKEFKRASANAWNAKERNTERPDSVPDTNHLHWNKSRILGQPFLFDA